MSNKSNESVDGVFNIPQSDRPAANVEQRTANVDKPSRPPRPKTPLSRETKVGLAVVGALVIIFVVVLVIRLRGDGQEQLSDASTSNEEPSTRPNKPDTKPGPTNGATVLSPTSNSAGQYWDGTARRQVQPRGTSVYASETKPAVDDLRGKARPYLPGGAGRDATAGADAPASHEESGAQERSWGFGGEALQASSPAAARGSAFSGSETDPFAKRPNATGQPTAFASDEPDSQNDAADSRELAAQDSVAPLFARSAAPRETRADGPSLVESNTRHESAADNDSREILPANPFERSTRSANSRDSESADATDASELKEENQPVKFAATAGNDSRQDSSKDTAKGAQLLPAKGIELQPAPRISSNALAGGDRRSSEAPPFAGGRKSPAAAAQLDDDAAGNEELATSPDNRKAPAKGDSYTVAANDTYWTIAQKTYGSGAYFKALYEHNRRRVEDADQLRAGMELSLPDEATLHRLYPTLCPKPQRVATTSRATRASAEAPVAGTYVVKDGDTLYEIARRQLGRSARWAEVYEANRDAIGEATDRLVPGTRLVLPEDSADRGQRPANRATTTRLETR